MYHWRSNSILNMLIYFREYNMKKVNLSLFRKRDQESFEVVKAALAKTFFDTQYTKNSTINTNTLISTLPDSDAKKKLSSWISGYDFAVIDIV